MKLSKYISLALFSLALATTARGQVDSSINYSYNHREFVKQEYQTLYSFAPSMLGLWDQKDFSYISLNYQHKDGNFRDLQSYKERGATEIVTESILSLDGGWRFYGKFGYVNGNSKDVRMNLSYDSHKNLSPYYYIIGAPGDWSFQNYLFEGSASKELKKDRLFAGINIKYYSYLNFRNVDYRNEQYNLNIKITPSVTYKIDKYNSVTLGALFSREKLEPEIYSKYQQSNAGDDYQVYINTGLGSFIKNAPQSTTTINKEYGAFLGYRVDRGSNRLDISALFSINNQNMENKMTSSISELGKELGKYENINLESNINYRRLLPNNRFIVINVGGQYIMGDGSPYNNVSKSYTKNYTVDKFAVNSRLDFYNSNSILTNLFLSAILDNKKELDMHYGQQVDFTNLKIGGGFMLNRDFGRVGDISFSADGFYSTNLDFFHDPVAASQNFITQKILYSKLSFLSADYVEANAKLVFTRALGVNYCVDFVLYGGYAQALTINYPDPYRFVSEGDSFKSLGISVIFNF